MEYTTYRKMKDEMNLTYTDIRGPVDTGIIPKILHLTWKTRTPPDNWAITLSEAKRLMPDWEINIMSDEDNDMFVEKYYPEFLSEFRDMKYPIMKADVIRYLLLHRYGGIYHDLDICPIKSYNTIRSYVYGSRDRVYLVESPQGGFTNSFMASTPLEPFWYDLVIHCFNCISWDRPFWCDINKSLYVLCTTGPYSITTFSKGKDYSILPSVLVNPYTMVDATYHWEKIRDEDPLYYKSFSLTRPLPGSSWVSGWENKLSLFYMKYMSNTQDRYIYLVLLLALIYIIVIAFKLT